MEAVAGEVGWMNRERRRGSVMALLARDLHLALGTGNEEFEHARILEYYRYSAYGTATVLPAHDDGTTDGLVGGSGTYDGTGTYDGSGSHHAWDGVEDSPLSLDDNNALMLARRNGTTHSGSNIPTSRDYSVPGARGESYGRVSQFGNFTTFTGRRLDPTTGLMYYRYRYYESVAGRFVGRDPAGYGDDSNLTSIGKNGVVANVDPMGLFRVSVTEVPIPKDDPSMPGHGRARIGECGAFRVGFQFELSNTPTPNSHIVQKIVFQAMICPCDPYEWFYGGCYLLEHVYWESFPLPQNARHPGRAAPGNPDDIWWWEGAGDNTWGFVVMSGTIKVFGQKGDVVVWTNSRGHPIGFSSIDIWNTIQGWQAGGHPWSGTGPSTTTEPSFWYQRGQASGFNRLSAFWYCCENSRDRKTQALKVSSRYTP